ncbi:MAG: NADH-quinone oxidoreductase subunit C [Lutimonas sp.]
MTNQEIQETISTWKEGLEFSEEESEFLNLTVDKEDLREISLKLRDTPELDFDYLFCLTGIDWGEELGVIYHLESIDKNHSMVIKVKTSDRENPMLDTVCDIWRTAEFHEMEVFDFFGIRFKGHPNMKRLFLPPEWEGYPLRKDYEDEVNMVIK